MLRARGPWVWRLPLLPVALIALLIHASCQSSTRTVTSEASEPEPKVSEGAIALSQKEIDASGIVVTPALEGSLRDAVTVQGVITPVSGRQAAVVPPFPGRFVPAGGPFPRVGGTVKEGQPLGDIEQELSATEETSIDEKRIGFDGEIERVGREIAQKARDLERAKALYEGGVIALKQLQQAETDLEIARSRLESARQARARYEALQSGAEGGSRRARITAPIGGTVTAVNAAPYQRVDNSRPILEVTNLDEVWAEAQVYEDYLAAVRAVRTVQITTRAAPGKTFIGTLVGVSPSADPVNKTQGLFFQVKNPDGVFALAMTVDVRLPSGVKSDGLIVPVSAVLEEEGGSFVFVEEAPGNYKKHAIQIALRSGDEVLVAGGIRRGDKVVSTGAQILLSAATEEK